MTTAVFLQHPKFPGLRFVLRRKTKRRVVVTGAKNHFEPNRLHRDRALQSAEALYHSGSLEAIFPYSGIWFSVLPEATRPLPVTEQSLRFEQARRSATRSDHHPYPLRSYLQEISEKGSNSLFVAEVFAGAERLRKWGKTPLPIWHTINL